MMKLKLEDLIRDYLGYIFRVPFWTSFSAG